MRREGRRERWEGTRKREKRKGRIRGEEDGRGLGNRRGGGTRGRTEEEGREEGSMKGD